MGEVARSLAEYATDDQIIISMMEKGEIKYDGLIDMHIHSKGSFDGMERVAKLIKMARINGVKMMSVTDHNTMSSLRDYLSEMGYDPNAVYNEIDGVKVVSGTEVTCRIDVKNVKGNDLKLHLLVYGARMDGSPLARLLQIKAANDFAYDFGMPIHCLKKLGLINNEQQEAEWKKKLKEYIIEERKHRPGVNEMTREMTADFLAQQNMNIAKSNRELCEMLSDYNVVARLNLKVEDIIECAHASGGICVLAHPRVNLMRALPANRENTIKILLGMGVDGFEMMCNSTDSEFNKMIRKVCNEWKGNKKGGKKAKKIIYTAGSDFHNTIDSRIGYVKYNDPISREDFKGIVDVIERMNDARLAGDPMYSPSQTELNRVEIILKHYVDENELCVQGSVSPEVAKALKDYKKNKKQANNKLGMKKVQPKKGKVKKHTKMKTKCPDIYYGKPREHSKKDDYTM